MNAMADSLLVTMSSPADRKVALFRALFRGREDVRGRLIRLASFVNPKYAEMQRLRLSVFATPRVIDCSPSRQAGSSNRRDCTSSDEIQPVGATDFGVAKG